MSILSVVIPAYNEGAMLHKTANVVSTILEENNIDYEYTVTYRRIDSHFTRS